jgi:hypothetical protein
VTPRGFFAQNDNKKYASSSIGRVAVSKTVGWGFESLLAWINRLQTSSAQRRTLNFECGERELDVGR